MSWETTKVGHLSRDEMTSDSTSDTIYLHLLFKIYLSSCFAIAIPMILGKVSVALSL